MHRLYAAAVTMTGAVNHPYRHAATRPNRRRTMFDRELGAVYLVVWLGSVARVGVALARHQPFGTELTLATLAIFVLPVLARAVF